MFREYGFYGASLSKLTERAGLERASLYHYFPRGKADMAEAVLLDAFEELRAFALDPLVSSESPKEKIIKMLAGLELFYFGGQKICFVTVFSLGDLSLSIKSSINAALKEWIALLKKVLEDLGIAKPFESAQSALAHIQGSLILAHAMDDPEIFLNCLSSLRDGWLGR